MIRQKSLVLSSIPLREAVTPHAVGAPRHGRKVAHGSRQVGETGHRAAHARLRRHNLGVSREKAIEVDVSVDSTAMTLNVTQQQ